MAPKKLIYILNSFGGSDASHFTHILHLLDVMASKGCIIELIIEKATSLPEFASPNVRAKKLNLKFPGLRHFELFLRISLLILQGYKSTFVRIAASSSIVASIAHRLFGGRSYLWQSGTTHAFDRSQKKSFAKIGWWLRSYLPNYLAIRIVHFFVTGPEAMVDYYVNTVNVPRKKIKLLYNDIQIDRFSELDRRQQRTDLIRTHGWPQDLTILLLVHRLSPVRRTLSYLEPFLMAMRAEATPSDWILVIAGGGSELPSAKALVAKLEMSNRVLFLGDVPNREIPALYAAADVFLHPTYTEGFPRVLIEAMAVGLPIASTDAGGTSQLLGPMQNNFVVEKERPDEFSRKAVDLIQNPSLWKDLKDENTQVVQRFSTDQVAAMYIEALFK